MSTTSSNNAAPWIGMPPPPPPPPGPPPRKNKNKSTKSKNKHHLPPALSTPKTLPPSVNPAASVEETVASTSSQHSASSRIREVSISIVEERRRAAMAMYESHELVHDRENESPNAWEKIPTTTTAKVSPMHYDGVVSQGQSWDAQTEHRSNQSPKNVSPFPLDSVEASRNTSPVAALHQEQQYFPEQQQYLSPQPSTSPPPMIDLPLKEALRVDPNLRSPHQLSPSDTPSSDHNREKTSPSMALCSSSLRKVSSPEESMAKILQEQQQQEGGNPSVKGKRGFFKKLLGRGKEKGGSKSGASVSSSTPSMSTTVSPVKVKRVKRNKMPVMGRPQDAKPGQSYQSTPHSAEIVVRKSALPSESPHHHELSSPVPTPMVERSVMAITTSTPRVQSPPTMTVTPRVQSPPTTTTTPRVQSPPTTTMTPRVQSAAVIPNSLSVTTTMTSEDEESPPLEFVESFSPPKFEHRPATVDDYDDDDDDDDEDYYLNNDYTMSTSEEFPPDMEHLGGSHAAFYSQDEVSEMTDTAFCLPSHRVEGATTARTRLPQDPAGSAYDPFGHYWEGTRTKAFFSPSDGVVNAIDPFASPFFIMSSNSEVSAPDPVQVLDVSVCDTGNESAEDFESNEIECGDQSDVTDHYHHQVTHYDEMHDHQVGHYDSMRHRYDDHEDTQHGNHNDHQISYEGNHGGSSVHNPSGLSLNHGSNPSVITSIKVTKTIKSSQIHGIETISKNNHRAPKAEVKDPDSRVTPTSAINTKATAYIRSINARTSPSSSSRLVGVSNSFAVDHQHSADPLTSHKETLVVKPTTSRNVPTLSVRNDPSHSTVGAQKVGLTNSTRVETRQVDARTISNHVEALPQKPVQNSTKRGLLLEKASISSTRGGLLHKRGLANSTIRRSPQRKVFTSSSASKPLPEMTPARSSRGCSPHEKIIIGTSHGGSPQRRAVISAIVRGVTQGKARASSLTGDPTKAKEIAISNSATRAPPQEKVFSLREGLPPASVASPKLRPARYLTKFEGRRPRPLTQNESKAVQAVNGKPSTTPIQSTPPRSARRRKAESTVARSVTNTVKIRVRSNSRGRHRDRIAVAKGIAIKSHKRKKLIAEGKAEAVNPAMKAKKMTTKLDCVSSPYQMQEEDIKDPIQRAGRRLLSKAAIPIQSEIRRYLAQREALDRLWALVEVQSYFRRWKCEASLLGHQNSALRIQAAFRGWQVRDTLAYKQYCATQIQSVVRGHLAAIRAYETLYRVVKLQAMVRAKLARRKTSELKGLVLLIQACYRGFRARLEVATLHYAATNIQSAWRGYATQLRFQLDIVDIITIQSLARQRAAHKAVEERRHLRRENAACMIQAAWRGFWVYGDFMMEKAARKIQATWRGFSVYSDFVREKAARKIQATWRGFSVYSYFVREKSACKIQAAWRGFRVYNDFVREKSARKIQAAWRGFSVYSDFVKEKAARKIQAAWRGFCVFSGFRRVKAARKIQAAWRGFWVYSDFIISMADILIVQTTARQWLAKRETYRLRRAARATLIQAHWRRYKAQICLMCSFVNIIIVQSVVRRHLGHKRARDRQEELRKQNEEKHKHQEEMRRKQKEMRRRQEEMRRKQEEMRRWQMESRAASVLQSWWRFNCSMKTRKCHAAATQIQKIWRGFWMYSHHIIQQFEAIRIQAVVRGFLAREASRFKLGCTIILQSTARGYLAKKRVHELRIAQVLVGSYAMAMRENMASKRIQRIWRFRLNEWKEKAAALVIERFFLMVKVEVDREIRRRERKRLSKRERRKREKKETDAMILERAWLNSVKGSDGDDQVQGINRSKGDGNLGHRSDTVEESNDDGNSDPRVDTIDRHSEGRVGPRVDRRSVSAPRTPRGMTTRSDFTTRSHNIPTEHKTARYTSRTRSDGFEHGYGRHPIEPHVFLPNAVNVRHSDDVSEVTSPTVFNRSAVPSRQTTFNREQLGDDLSLEEAWIDTEIQQAKERRLSAEQYLQRHGIQPSSYHKMPPHALRNESKNRFTEGDTPFHISDTPRSSSSPMNHVSPRRDAPFQNRSSLPSPRVGQKNGRPHSESPRNYGLYSPSNELPRSQSYHAQGEYSQNSEVLRSHSYHAQGEFSLNTELHRSQSYHAQSEYSPNSEGPRIQNYHGPGEYGSNSEMPRRQSFHFQGNSPRSLRGGPASQGYYTPPSQTPPNQGHYSSGDKPRSHKRYTPPDHHTQGPSSPHPQRWESHGHSRPKGYPEPSRRNDDQPGGYYRKDRVNMV